MTDNVTYTDIPYEDKDGGVVGEQRARKIWYRCRRYTDDQLDAGSIHGSAKL